MFSCYLHLEIRPFALLLAKFLKILKGIIHLVRRQNFTEFTGKPLYQRLFLNKVAAQKETLVQVCKYYKISKNSFFDRKPPVDIMGSIYIETKYLLNAIFTELVGKLVPDPFIKNRNLFSCYLHLEIRPFALLLTKFLKILKGIIHLVRRQNFTEFTGKPLYQRLFLNKVAAQKETLVQVCKYYKISKNSFFDRKPPVDIMGSIYIETKYLLNAIFTEKYLL